MKGALTNSMKEMGSCLNDDRFKIISVFEVSQVMQYSYNHVSIVYGVHRHRV